MARLGGHSRLVNTNNSNIHISAFIYVGQDADDKYVVSETSAWNPAKRVNILGNDRGGSERYHGGNSISHTVVKFRRCHERNIASVIFLNLGSENRSLKLRVFISGAVEK